MKSDGLWRIKTNSEFVFMRFYLLRIDVGSKHNTIKHKTSIIYAI